MNVKDAMSTNTRSVKPDTKVLELASLMCLYRFHGLPVVDDDGVLVGVVAEKDMLNSLFPKIEDIIADGMATVDLDREMGRYGEVLQQSVSDLMTPNPVAVDPEMHLLRAATVMVRHNFRRIPVAEEGKLIGMLTLGDVHKAIFHANMTGTLKAD